jgi:hypothetical protein
MSTMHEGPFLGAQPGPEARDVLTRVDDFQHPDGWADSYAAPRRARNCCEQLEEGRILFFERNPFELTKPDQEFLLTWQKAGLRGRHHVAYHRLDEPLADAVPSKIAGRRVHGILRNYSTEVTRSLGWLLSPYSMNWTQDHASLRLKPGKGRLLSLLQRHDLLHLDVFSSSPTRGRRILRCFTNINPVEPVVWVIADNFEKLARGHAEEAGLKRIAARGSPRTHPLLRELKGILGWKTGDLTAYDRFMLRFHQHLKQSKDWQEKSRKIRLEFPPGSSWLCFVDAVPHAELASAGVLEQAFTIPLRVMIRPERAPIRLLEAIAGLPLVDFTP